MENVTRIVKKSFTTGRYIEIPLARRAISSLSRSTYPRIVFIEISTNRRIAFDESRFVGTVTGVFRVVFIGSYESRIIRNVHRESELVCVVFHETTRGVAFLYRQLGLAFRVSIVSFTNLDKSSIRT